MYETGWDILQYKWKWKSLEMLKSGNTLLCSAFKNISLLWWWVRSYGDGSVCLCVANVKEWLYGNGLKIQEHVKDFRNF